MGLLTFGGNNTGSMASAGGGALLHGTYASPGGALVSESLVSSVVFVISPASLRSVAAVVSGVLVPPSVCEFWSPVFEPDVVVGLPPLAVVFVPVVGELPDDVPFVTEASCRELVSSDWVEELELQATVEPKRIEPNMK